MDFKLLLSYYDMILFTHNHSVFEIVVIYLNIYIICIYLINNKKSLNNNSICSIVEVVQSSVKFGVTVTVTHSMTLVDHKQGQLH